VKARSPREHALELLAAADAELGENFVQVVLDRLAADEQLRGDVWFDAPSRAIRAILASCG